jgi:hypothetical protein
MASYANSIVASICCSYFEDDGTQWQIQVRPTCIDISCPKRYVGITMLVDKEKDEKEITYDDATEYKCGADVTEGTFESDDATLTIGVRRYVDFEEDENGTYEMDEDGEPVEDAYVELIGRRFRSKHFMLVNVARILMAIAKNAPVEELKGLGARRISFLS